MGTLGGTTGAGDPPHAFTGLSYRLVGISPVLPPLPLPLPSVQDRRQQRGRVAAVPFLWVGCFRYLG